MLVREKANLWYYEQSAQRTKSSTVSQPSCRMGSACFSAPCRRRYESVLEIRVASGSSGRPRSCLNWVIFWGFLPLDAFFIWAGLGGQAEGADEGSDMMGVEGD